MTVKELIRRLAAENGDARVLIVSAKPFAVDVAHVERDAGSGTVQVFT